MTLALTRAQKVGVFAVCALLLAMVGLLALLDPDPGAPAVAGAPEATRAEVGTKSDEAAAREAGDADPAVYINNPENFDAATGYRIKHYRAPVPERIDGAETVLSDEVEEFVQNGSAVLLDVMPSYGGGADAKTGAWRLTRERRHIPGSVWLPDVGEGRLTPRMEAYFKSNLERLTAGARDKAIVIYCQADCWMGWNASKRAAAWGYSNLHWYIEGTDGWRDWNGTFDAAVPVPITAP